MLLQYNNDEKELIKGVEIQRDQHGHIRLPPIIAHIASMGFPVKDNLISYYSILEKVFVFVGKDPLSSNIVIP